MLRRIDTLKQSELQTTTVRLVERDAESAEQQKAQLRRLMYERIARGQAMAESETQADGKWLRR